jgi:hypothetical protein
MRRSGQRAIGRIVFDDPNLISPAGLVPTMASAQKVGLVELADSHISIPTAKDVRCWSEGPLTGCGDGGRARAHYDRLPQLLEDRSRPYSVSAHDRGSASSREADGSADRYDVREIHCWRRLSATACIRNDRFSRARLTSADRCVSSTHSGCSRVSSSIQVRNSSPTFVAAQSLKRMN